MTIERKLATVALVVLALTAALAVAQVTPGKQKQGSNSDATPAAQGAFSSLKLSPVQDCLTDIIVWEQSNALQKMGGHPTPDYDSMSAKTMEARMEVVRSCNLYLRAIMTASQQQEYDRVILDPVGHPLPPKWEKMRLAGTLAKSLLVSDKEQDRDFVRVLNQFRDRQHEIWGRGNDGGYAKNHALLIKEFRAVLNADQLKEFDSIWKSYKKEIDAAKDMAVVNP